MSNELDFPIGDGWQSAPAASLPKLPPEPDQVVRQAFSAWIAPHWKSPVVCPVCSETAWTILNPVDPPLRYTVGYVLTLIPVMCDTCKHVLLFSGNAAGLFDSEGNPLPRPSGQ